MTTMAIRNRGHVHGAWADHAAAARLRAEAVDAQRITRLLDAANETMPTDAAWLDMLRDALQARFGTAENKVVVEATITAARAVIFWYATPLGAHPTGGEYFRSTWTETAAHAFTFTAPQRVRRLTTYEPLAAGATQTATQHPPDLPGALKALETELRGFDARLDAYAAAKGLRFVEVETDEADARAMFAVPTPWDEARNANEENLLPTLAPMSDAEAARLRDETIRLRALIDDATTTFTERTRASTRLAAIEAKLRAAGRWDRLGMGGVQQPVARHYFPDGSWTERSQLAPGGVQQPDATQTAGPQFAEPTPTVGAHLDSRPGAARGDERIDRRRRATELERQIRIARKKARGGAFADRARWDLELAKLSAELEAIRDAERAERDQYRRV
jgi:hypothetical protein